MIKESGYIVYTLPGSSKERTKEVIDIGHLGRDLHIFVNDIESEPSSFYYQGKTDTWLVPKPNSQGNWKLFKGKVLKFNFTISV